jgi:uncharacterized protein YlxW (UPF0749 family)
MKADITKRVKQIRILAKRKPLFFFLLSTALLLALVGASIFGTIQYHNQGSTITRLQGDNSDLQSSNDDLQSQVDDLNNKNDDLTNQVDDLQNQVDELQANVDSSATTTSVSVPSITQVCGPLPSISLNQQSPDSFNNAMSKYTSCTNNYFKTYL